MLHRKKKTNKNSSIQSSVARKKRAVTTDVFFAFILLVISFAHNNFKRCLLDHRFYSTIYDFTCRTTILVGLHFSISIRMQQTAHQKTYNTACSSFAMHRALTHFRPSSTLPKVITTHYFAHPNTDTVSLTEGRKTETERKEKTHAMHMHTHTQ